MLNQLLRRKRNRKASPPTLTLQEQFPDVDETLIEIYSTIQSATMTSPERVFALCDAVDYVCQSKIEGDIVECGVWRGGSMMAVCERLKFKKQIDRQLWLYDTYCGMPEPSSIDVDFAGNNANEMLDTSDVENPTSIWCNSPLEEVQNNIHSTEYPKKNVNFVEGDVCETLRNSDNVPRQIAVLRLDTDWYESTRMELETLFPRLVPGGVLIIDDYGHWGGCRKAVDEFIANQGIKILLQRIDYTGRIGVKT